MYLYVQRKDGFRFDPFLFVEASSRPTIDKQTNKQTKQSPRKINKGLDPRCYGATRKKSRRVADTGVYTRRNANVKKSVGENDGTQVAFKATHRRGGKLGTNLSQFFIAIRSGEGGIGGDDDVGGWARARG